MAIVKENTIVLKPFDFIDAKHVGINVFEFLHADETGVEQTAWSVAFEIWVKSGDTPIPLVLETQICDPDMEVAAYLGYTRACTIFGSVMDNIMVTSADGGLITEIDADELVEFMESCTCDEDHE